MYPKISSTNKSFCHIISIGKCQSSHIIPSNITPILFPNLICKISCKYPLQPYSSPKRDETAPTEKMIPAKNFPNDKILNPLTISVAIKYIIKIYKFY